MSIELKSCPFCGGEPSVNFDCESDEWKQVVCDNENCPAPPCTADNGRCETIESVCNRWNTRARPTGEKE